MSKSYEFKEQEHKLSKDMLKTLNQVVVDYANKHNVTIDRAVIDLMVIDNRFKDGFTPSEIGVIIGLPITTVNAIMEKAMNKIKSPKLGLGQRLKVYTTSGTSVYESDF